MGVPGSAAPFLLAKPRPYLIERSLRFNSADSASLSLVSYTGSGTFSCWVKRCKLGAAQTIISGVAFNASDQLNGSTAVFRDPSAWMHIVVSSSGTYVNGASVGSGTSITPSAIGSGCDLYLADVHFIDGQNLGPSSFGAADSNGIWQPKTYSGTYGTNGFHLTFSDNSTAASLGDDSSHSGNNWTVNNISVATGAGNDSLVDVPTNGSQTDTGAGNEARGNYCTVNPLHLTRYSSSGNFTLSNGNLDLSITSTGDTGVYSTFFLSTGKWYWEVAVTSLSTSLNSIGFSVAGAEYYIGYSSGSYGYRNDGLKIQDAGGSGGSSSYGATYAANDVIGIALDLDNGTAVFYKNGVSQGTAFTGLSGSFSPAFGRSGGTSDFTVSCNFGQRPFAYPVSGFKALCAANLPSTTITTSGSYTGNGVADGPFVFLNGVPTAMTVNGNAVTFGTHADKLSNGFKIRTTSTTYNQNASVYSYTITSTGDPFKTARAQSN